MLETDVHSNGILFFHDLADGVDDDYESNDLMEALKVLAPSLRETLTLDFKCDLIHGITVDPPVGANDVGKAYTIRTPGFELSSRLWNSISVGRRSYQCAHYYDEFDFLKALDALFQI